MERFDVIRRVRAKQVLALTLALSSVFVLTGCSEAIDSIRPELNRDDRLLVSRDTLTVSFEDTVLNPGGNFGPSAGDSLDQNNPFDPDSGGGDVDFGEPLPEFAPVKSGFVGATSYKKYLEEEIVKPVDEAINALPATQRNKIYFRVMHAGYTPSEETQSMTATPAYTHTLGGSLKTVSGKSLTTIAYRFFSQLSINSRKLSIAASAAQTTLSNFINKYADGDVNWDKLDWLGATELKGFPSTILAMWGSEGYKNSKLQSYKHTLESEIFSAIPNVSMNYYLNTTNQHSQGYFYLNRVTASAGVTKGYDYSIPLLDVNKIFTSVNQFPARDANPKREVMTDEGSVVFSYYDGYNRTLVLLATAPGESLADNLGDKASELISLISGMASCEQWQEIPLKYMNGQNALAQPGYRGVN